MHSPARLLGKARSLGAVALGERSCCREHPLVRPCWLALLALGCCGGYLVFRAPLWWRCYSSLDVGPGQSSLLLEPAEVHGHVVSDSGKAKCKPIASLGGHSPTLIEYGKYTYASKLSEGLSICATSHVIGCRSWKMSRALLKVLQVCMCERDEREGAPA